MCQICVDKVRELFPGLEEKKLGAVLMDCTCFPFGDPEQVLAQLKPMAKRYNNRKKTPGWQDRWLHAENCRVAAEMNKEFDEYKKRKEAQNTTIEQGEEK